LTNNKNDSKMTAEGTVGAPTCFSCGFRSLGGSGGGVGNAHLKEKDPSGTGQLEKPEIYI
jgi:hypothetical protein